jgi:glyoxylase-like metal-dependent hydrolase (beta-lactamase superfamily II)
MKITDNIHRLGSQHVNFYAVEDGGRVTIVDTGLSVYWDQIPALLSSIGRALTDVAAIVQTHYHPDHIGNTERLRRETGAPVFVHEIEAPGLRGEEKVRAPKGMPRVILNPRAYKGLAYMAKNGGMKFPTVEKVETYSDSDVLDVPGRPKVVFTPGHSPGHSALLIEDQGVLFTGDAMVMRDLRTNTGPRLMEINADRDTALRTLNRFEDIDAKLLLPGHGEPYRGRPRDAAALARAASA